MLVTLELALILLVVLGLGVWGIVSGIRLSRQHPPEPPISAPELAALAQPYRRLLGEAIEIEREVTRRAATAPKPVQRRLGDLAQRIRSLITRALPRARHGTDLAGYLLRLAKDEPQYQETLQAMAEVERELEAFVAALRSLRAKVYRILTDASRLSLEAGLERDLSEAVFEVTALEEAFAELSGERR